MSRDKSTGHGEQPDRPEEKPPPDIDFSTFIFSLSTAAQFHLGDVSDPGTGESHENLPMAKQTIDILGMLENKTKGNLTDPEAKLLEGLLYSLRMRYIEKTRG